MDMEQEWAKHPVIRLDMSNGGSDPKGIIGYLDDTFHKYEALYDITLRPDNTLAVRFKNIIEKACTTTGRKVAILIDEYDSPLQHSWKTPQHEACTGIYKDVFAVLKTQDKYEKFVFITGITKFTQISLFSVLNNLSNISFNPQYAALCGITQQEITDNFLPEIKAMGEKNNWTVDEVIEQLKDNYDGYHSAQKHGRRLQSVQPHQRLSKQRHQKLLGFIGGYHPPAKIC